MRVRIKQLPQPGEFDEYDLRRFQAGEVYEVTSQLGMFLIVAGYADSVPAFTQSAAADRPARKSTK